MRAQKSGHIIQVSSIGGLVTFPGIGMYHASKWALEGFTDALSREVAQFGIKVTLIEPAGYETDWAGSSAKHARPIKEYDEVRNTPRPTSAKRGRPEATAEAILKIVDAENPPLRLLLGVSPFAVVKDTYQKRIDTWEEWKEVTQNAQGN